MKPHGISIQQVKTADELRRAQRIREIVLEDEQGFSHKVNVDGQDPSAMHVLVLDQGLRSVPRKKACSRGSPCSLLIEARAWAGQCCATWKR